MKAQQFYVMNQIAIFNKGEIWLQSYDSIVCKVNDVEVVMFKNWDYSITTLKYVKLFIQQYAPSLYIEIMKQGRNVFKKGVEKLIKNGNIIYKEA